MHQIMENTTYDEADPTPISTNETYLAMRQGLIQVMSSRKLKAFVIML